MTVHAHIRLAGRIHEVEIDGDTATVDGITFPIEVIRNGRDAVVKTDLSLHTVGRARGHRVVVDGQNLDLELLELRGVGGLGQAAGGHGPIKPPMNGKLVELLVKPGQAVAAGDVLFVLEAMKMRNEIKAGADGVVGEVRAKVGDAVDPGTIILVVDAPG